MIDMKQRYEEQEQPNDTFSLLGDFHISQTKNIELSITLKNLKFKNCTNQDILVL